MPKQKESPYVCHIFVCTNDRKGRRPSCADRNSPAIREILKKEIEDRGWKGRIRVSQCGCMGLCATGPNIMIYPQRIWFSEALPDDAKLIVGEIEAIMEKQV